jgi:hypothetical protein
MSKRLNVFATMVIILGGLSLTSSPASAGSSGDDECKTEDGATCTGTPCCVIGENCFTGLEMCQWAFCLQYPDFPECAVT